MLNAKFLPILFRWVFLVLVLAGCETTGQLTQTPARMLYIEAEGLENEGMQSDAITKYEKLAKENPGTRLATFAYLRTAELQVKLEKWKEAAANYRAFLTLNPNSHLTPYVLYRLLQSNHQRSYTGSFFPSREIDRDMEPNRQIILEYKRFALLYPTSAYLEEVVPFHKSAKETLAASEYLVGNYYFENKQFQAAIGRFIFLLKNYPEFPQTEDVLDQLIQAYYKNDQPEQAKEMERAKKLRLNPAAQQSNATKEQQSSIIPLGQGADRS